LCSSTKRFRAERRSGAGSHDAQQSLACALVYHNASKAVKIRLEPHRPRDLRESSRIRYSASRGPKMERARPNLSC
jgi:hypothetical protein